MTESKSEQQAHSERALNMATEKQGDAGHPENEPAPNEGVIATPRKDYPPSGAFDAEGREPALRRSRER